MPSEYVEPKHHMTMYGSECGPTFEPEEEYRVVIVDGDGFDIATYPFSDESSAIARQQRIAGEWHTMAQGGEAMENSRRVEVRRVVTTYHLVCGTMISEGR